MYLEEIYIPLGTVSIAITFNLLKIMIELLLSDIICLQNIYLILMIHSCSLIKVWKTWLQIQAFKGVVKAVL